MDLKGRNFLTLKDFTPEEIGYFLQLSKASPILRGYWEECSTELSIVDSDRKS